MSKKSRRRNRKILGALAAGLGAAALMRGRGTAQGVSGADKAKFTSDAAYTAPVTGTEYPGANVDTAPKTNWISPRMRGNNPNDPTGAIGQTTRADYARRHRNAITGVDGPPSVLNPYRPQRVHNRFNRNVSYAKGGRVRGAGIAKRGLGRAMKKGRK